MKRSKPSGDKWSNYSSAADLGLAPGEEAPSSYEIEQMVRGRTTKVGEWEEVVVPSPSAEGAEKRKAEEDPEDLREFKIQQKKHADPYDDDDWDPSALTKLKFKSKEKKIGDKEPEPEADVKTEQSGEGSRSGPSGWAKAEVKAEPPEGVKTEPTEAAEEVKQEPDVKEEVGEPEQPVKAEPAETAAPAAGGSLFKKRRPPPSSRKK